MTYFIEEAEVLSDLSSYLSLSTLKLELVQPTPKLESDDINRLSIYSQLMHQPTHELYKDVFKKGVNNAIFEKAVKKLEKELASAPCVLVHTLAFPELPPKMRHPRLTKRNH